MKEEQLRDKRLLILGGAIQCLKVVRAARALGVHTIITDIAANPEVAEAADETLNFSVMDVDGLYTWCREHPVDGVLNYCVDPAQKPHQALCQRLGLPCYGSARQYSLLTDKAQFKRLCRENCVDVIEEYRLDALDKVEYPVIIKPAESSGSRGIEICRTQEELEAANVRVCQVSRNHEVIIEKFMEHCQDFTMTYLIIDGQPYLVRLGDRYSGRTEDGLNHQCICTITPSRYMTLYMETAHQNIVNMLRKTGIQNGPVFFQGFIDRGKFRIYDPGIRFPGGEYDQLYQHATGIDIMSALVGFALTGSVPLSDDALRDSFRLNGKVGVQLTVTARAGTIAVYDGFDDIARIPGVVCVARKARVGAEIPNSGDIKQRVIEIAFLVDGYDDVADKADLVYKRLKILDAEGRDMVVSKYNGMD